MKRLISIAAAGLLVAGCQTTPDEPLRATAALQPTKGSKAFGEVTFEQDGDKVRMIAFAQGLKPDAEHGFHIHEVGDCSSGDGMSTKGHFNPAGKPHGDPTKGEHHVGDLPALRANNKGRAKVDVSLSGVSLQPGASNNIIGRGMIIHADPDDYKTQPTGNSGARIACGVVKAG
jgi:superoxide dismutase, Cu-Zn family